MTSPSHFSERMNAGYLLTHHRLFYKRLPLFMPRQRNMVCIDSRYCGFCSSCQCSSMETNSQDLVCWDSCYCHQGLFYQSLQYYPFLLKSDTFLFFLILQRGFIVTYYLEAHRVGKKHNLEYMINKSDIPAISNYFFNLKYFRDFFFINADS